MNQLLTAWSGIDTRRRMVVAAALVAGLVCMIGIWRLSARPEMALLYAGLPADTAGEVIAALDAQALPYEVRGSAIYVPGEVRDSTRLALAAQGMPATGGVGYELLDSLNGFGTTAQMFDAAYWRAKEGELARTIVSSREIRAARVHIATPPRHAFAREMPVTASVTITPAQAGIGAAQAESIRYLVASAVAGLAVEDVAVIDSMNGALIQGGPAGPLADAGELDPRATQMKANIERLLEAHVGRGKAVVEVHIDADMDSQVITERVVDPTSRVAISSDLQETSESATGVGGGAVTVASNLPAGDAEAGGERNSSNRSETRERQNFEVSETRRERVIQPGQIRRVSVAVIVDGVTRVAADGTRSWAPRREEEMAALRTLVESAIGFDPARGDRVTLETLEFPAPAALGTEAGGGMSGPWSGGGLMSLIQTLVLGAVALILGLFVVRPLLSRPRELPAPEILAGELDLTARHEPDFALGPTASASMKADQHKIRNLRQLVGDRGEESRDVLRRWIEAPEPLEEAR